MQGLSKEISEASFFEYFYFPALIYPPVQDLFIYRSIPGVKTTQAKEKTRSAGFEKRSVEVR